MYDDILLDRMVYKFVDFDFEFLNPRIEKYKRYNGNIIKYYSVFGKYVTLWGRKKYWETVRQIEYIRINRRKFTFTSKANFIETINLLL